MKLAHIHLHTLGSMQGVQLLCWSLLQKQFDEAKDELCLDSIRPAVDGNMESRMETSIIALGEILSWPSQRKYVL